jgi:hypothetical protein
MKHTTGDGLAWRGGALHPFIVEILSLTLQPPPFPGLPFGSVVTEHTTSLVGQASSLLTPEETALQLACASNLDQESYRADPTIKGRLD